jgi:hypothetical protein
MLRMVTALMVMIAALVVASPVQAISTKALRPEAREKAIAREMNHLLVPGPAGWAMVRDIARYQLLENQLQGVRYIIYTPQGAIHYTFGRWGDEAWSVALCEGGRPVPSVNATNGQYKGMFQMGSYARSMYGHGRTPLAQARAAFLYFANSGYDWSPWSCKP